MNGPDEPACAAGPARAVSAHLHYVDRTNEPITTDLFDESRSTAPSRPYSVTIGDARRISPTSTLAAEGFTIVAKASSVDRFDGPFALDARYAEEIVDLVGELTGADRVLVPSPAMVRVTSPMRRAVLGAPGPAMGLHLDYSAASARNQLTTHPGLAEVDLAGYSRILIYNTWRPLGPPPQDLPLALSDKRSVGWKDTQLARVSYGQRAINEFEITLLCHDPGHRWWYFPDMTRDELLVFQGWDLGPDPQPSVFHGAFVDPSCGAGAAPRSSVEMRAYALFKY